MIYEYSGFLKTVLHAPDPEATQSLASVVFTADDIARWSFQDLASDPEWQHVPVTSRRTEHGLRLEGRFSDVRQIDNLAADDPSFWVAAGTLNWRDDRLPIDLDRYPIAELTYRCTSSNARPAWVFTYAGGVSFDGLTPTQEWRTIARRIQHYGFPRTADGIILRLYSISRTIESFEVESIRFREMTPEEADACREFELGHEQAHPVKHYPILDEFMPFGCYMDAGSSKRLAAMLGISLQEYWALVLEDMARHHHNAVALEKIDRFNPEEWRDLLEQIQKYDIKIAAMYDLPLSSPPAYVGEFVDTHIRPYANNPGILSWSLYNEPPEHGFNNLMQAKPLIEQADPNHPMAVLMRDPNSFPLFSRFFSASGIAQYGSHSPWQVGDMVRTHLPLSRGQQFWFIAPAFIYATDTPEWHTCPEMRLMMNLAFASGAKGWFTYSYHNDPIWVRGSCQRSLTGPFLTFSDLWSELSARVESFNALAPLFLNSHPEWCFEDWFISESVAHANAGLPERVSPASMFRLRGKNEELYGLLSNDIREMTTLHTNILPPAAKGLCVYDLSDYIHTRVWKPMTAKRHLEMFPGQVHLLLVAEPDVCEHWHEVIAQRLITSDRRQIRYDLDLAQAYGLFPDGAESLIRAESDDDPARPTRAARDALLDAIYQAPQLCEPRSKLIEASASICACDGSLCRLLGRGKADQARQLGFKVIPLARELTHLRLELRRGRGSDIVEHCGNLTARALDVLTEIRAIS